MKIEVRLCNVLCGARGDVLLVHCSRTNMSRVVWTARERCARRKLAHMQCIQLCALQATMLGRYDPFIGAPMRIKLFQSLATIA